MVGAPIPRNIHTPVYKYIYMSKGRHGETGERGLTCRAETFWRAITLYAFYFVDHETLRGTRSSWVPAAASPDGSIWERKGV